MATSAAAVEAAKTSFHTGVGERAGAQELLKSMDRAAAGFAKARMHGPNAFGMFSCSKTTNEMNYIAQKFTRAVMGSNNVDSCNRT